MTEESNKILVGKLKQKLNITWNDEKTDRKLSDIVSDAEAVMNHKLGAEIDYSAPESGIGRTLFINYCVYAWNDCENEFDEAYREMILMARAFYEVQGHEGQDHGTE